MKLDSSPTSYYKEDATLGNRSGWREWVKDFRQLKVWEKAHPLTLEIYQATASFPRAETYGLTSQIRRASASICANLAEGCGRTGDAELARFCAIARGSASELEYHLLLARDLHYLQTSDHEKLAAETTEVKRISPLSSRS